MVFMPDPASSFVDDLCEPLSADPELQMLAKRQLEFVVVLAAANCEAGLGAACVVLSLFLYTGAQKELCAVFFYTGNYYV